MLIPKYTKKLTCLKLVDKDGNDVTPVMETDSKEVFDQWTEMEALGAASGVRFREAFSND